VIGSKLDQGLSAQRIYQDLVAEAGFEGGYDSVKRYVRRHRQTESVPFRRMECEPGQECQVDFGAGGPVVADGRRRRTHVMRVVLSHSRKGYSESAFRQTTESFLRCLEDSFWHFGGVPRTVVIDNLRAAVAEADWYDPQVHPIIESFCRHYGTVILPARPYTPRHKGKVERGIAYVKDNALKGKTFGNLAEQNRHLLDWESRVADTRIHGTTRQQVGKVFAEVERRALGPLPATRFAFFREAQRSVHRDGHVEVDKAYYSVPPEYVGRRLWVRWDGRLVRVFNQRMEQVAVHAQLESGRFSTQDRHIHSRKISAVERGTSDLLRRAGLIGEDAERWARAMLEARGIRGVRVLVGLLNLAGRHSDEQIDRACGLALSHNAFRLRTIRELIRRGGDRQESFDFLAEHEIIREMTAYGQLVRTAFAQPGENHPFTVSPDACSAPPLGVREPNKLISMERPR
jgi:transposase